MDDLLLRALPALLAAPLALLALRPGASLAPWFGEAVPSGRWLRNAVLLAALGLALALCLTLARTPGLLAALWDSGAARGPFLGSVLGSGLPLLVAVNFFAAMLWALSERRRPGRAPAPALLLDLARRVGLFAAATILYLAGPPLLSGSAAGFAEAGEALLRAAGFRDLSGTFLGAALLAPLPLWAAAAARLLRRDGRWPVAGGLAAFGLLLAVLGG